jgi:hypothetical protein
MKDFESWTVAICGILYLLTAIGFVMQKKFPWAIAYAAYALANVGLIWAALESSK